MQRLFTMILMFSTQYLFAVEYTEEIITNDEQIYVYDLNCILPLGDETAVYTHLKSLPKVAHKIAKMNHQDAITNGCDRNAMKSLWIDSSTSFGFVSVKTMVIKRTSLNSRLVNGKCQRRYDEKIMIEFDHGITLRTSEIGKLIPAKGC